MQRSHSRRIIGRAAALTSGTTLALVLALCSLSAEISGKAAKRKADKRKDANPTVTASPGGGGQSLTDIPLPIGHEAKGLVLPDFDVEGHLRGKFVAGSARRLDQDHVGFRDLKITTYDDSNEIDLEIAMQTSVFDLTTRILRSDERTTVRRADFNIEGDSAVFDTNARTSRIVGNVKMVITDQSRFVEKQNP
jgi:hypothetical protein